MSSQSVVEGVQYQGTREALMYSLATTPWGSNPANVVVIATDLNTGLDVTNAVTTGSASVVGDVITLPKIAALVAEHRYRVDITFVCGLNTFNAYVLIEATR